MAEKHVAPFGSWESPFTADLITGSTIGLGNLQIDGEHIYWTESRPTENGRVAIVRLTPGGAVSDAIPAAYNARSRVHEYGGGAFRVNNQTVYFSNFADNRLYRVAGGEEPIALTESPHTRYADMIVDERRHRLIAVREDHSQEGQEPENTLVSVGTRDGGERVLAAGHSFYACPRLSPDGRSLAWLTWDHPDMPWDGTELWLAPLGEDGGLGDAARVAGGPGESIYQPEWSPDGQLYFVSDRTGWWNLYRHEGTAAAAICPMEAEFGEPMWVFGMATYRFLSPREAICIYSSQGIEHLARLDVTTGRLEEVSSRYSSFGAPQAAGGSFICTAASATELTAVVRLDLAAGRWEVLRRSGDLRIDEGYIARPEAIAFPTEGGLTTHAFYYRPTNKEYSAPPGELPPLLVKSHGGPTDAANSSLKLGIQFWTSRGIAVVDVNYGGSSGYGREYRRRLEGQWGVVDVDDCVNAARYLVEQGLADPERLAIDGGSAGGYTTLCALAFRDTFKAGASYYGISDAAALAAETHKFESHYHERLIGPFPQEMPLYRARSPIHAVDRLACPLILFQGLDDRVVPPNQAEMMYEAVRAKGIPVAYVPFEGEGHGFRKAANIKRALEAELYFFSRVFGFTPAGAIETVAIANL